MFLIIAAVVILAVLLAVSNLRPGRGGNGPNLGQMSEHWLAEHRAVHSG